MEEEKSESKNSEMYDQMNLQKPNFKLDVSKVQKIKKDEEMMLQNSLKMFSDIMDKNFEKLHHKN